MEIDEEALEVAREHEDFRESSDDGLFIIEPISEDGKVFYLDLRGDSWQTYGYKGGEDIQLPEMKPTCLKEVKSEIRAIGSKTIEDFA